MEKMLITFILCIFQPYRVRGCILTLAERMDEEFTKIMQNTDPHSQGENDFYVCASSLNQSVYDAHVHVLTSYILFILE